jgi:hypothetical protein
MEHNELHGLLQLARVFVLLWGLALLVAISHPADRHWLFCGIASARNMTCGLYPSARCSQYMHASA